MTWGPVSVSDSTGPPQPADRVRRHARRSRRRSEHEGQLHAEGHEDGQATEEGSEDQPAGAHRRFFRLPGTADLPRIVPCTMITTMGGRAGRGGLGLGLAALLAVGCAGRGDNESDSAFDESVALEDSGAAAPDAAAEAPGGTGGGTTAPPAPAPGGP